MSYYEVLAEVFDNAGTLLAWARLAMAAARRSPAKKAKQAKKRGAR